LIGLTTGWHRERLSELVRGRPRRLYAANLVGTGVLALLFIRIHEGVSEGDLR
jgi:hypothetical protein